MLETAHQQLPMRSNHTPNWPQCLRTALSIFSQATCTAVRSIEQKLKTKRLQLLDRRFIDHCSHLQLQPRGGIGSRCGRVHCVARPGSWSTFEKPVDGYNPWHPWRKQHWDARHRSRWHDRYQRRLLHAAQFRRRRNASICMGSMNGTEEISEGENLYGERDDVWRAVGAHRKGSQP